MTEVFVEQPLASPGSAKKQQCPFHTVSECREGGQTHKHRDKHLIIDSTCQGAGWVKKLSNAHKYFVVMWTGLYLTEKHDRSLQRHFHVLCTDF